LINFPKFKLRFEGHVTVFDNVKWHLECCQRNNWIIKVTWRLICNLTLYNCLILFYQFSKVWTTFWRSRDCFWECQWNDWRSWKM